jgi:uncharacterized membrane protein HdeD (DUF308 family)
MSQHAEAPVFASPPAPASLRDSARRITGHWWISLVAGVASLAAALVISQFDEASVTTVGILVGIMFTFAGIQNVAAATVPGSTRAPSIVFAVLFGVAAILCFVDPAGTFVGLADMLGFLFLIVGVWWMVRAFLEMPVNPVWWLGLISGILMTILAFWTAGQFFIAKAYVLLGFAGIWALMQGIDGIVRAFAVHRLHREL